MRAGRSRRLAVLVAPNAGACADERAAARPGPHRLVQRAAAHVLAPRQEPHGPAVVPHARPGAAVDLHRIARVGHLVEGLGVGRRHVHATVAHVAEALVADRPEGIVQVLAAPGDAHRPGHRDAVARPGHLDRVALFDGQVVAVRRVVAGPPAADRPVRELLAVAVQVHEVLRGADHGDQRRADPEALLEGVVPEQPRGALDAVEVRRDRHPRVRLPVVARAEVQAGRSHPAVAVPVPGAHDPPRGPDVERPLHRRPVPDRPVEVEDDRHPHAVGLVIALHDPGRERVARREGPERAGLRHPLA